MFKKVPLGTNRVLVSVLQMCVSTGFICVCVVVTNSPRPCSPAVNEMDLIESAFISQGQLMPGQGSRQQLIRRKGKCVTLSKKKHC